MVWVVSLDDMHSENIWFSWYKPSKYRKKLICHACDGGRRTDGRRKVENRAVFCWTRNRKKNEGYSNTRATFTVVDDFGSWVFIYPLFEYGMWFLITLVKASLKPRFLKCVTVICIDSQKPKA